MLMNSAVSTVHAGSLPIQPRAVGVVCKYMDMTVKYISGRATMGERRLAYGPSNLCI